MKTPRSLLITGASSGIGKALALAYAAPEARLALVGRDAARLDFVIVACRARGARVQSALLDVTDRAAMARWIDEVDTAAPIDLVIANAGISAGPGGDYESEQQTRKVFAVNLDGVINTVLPLIPKFVVRGRGQIALVSSLASFSGISSAPAYCASKAAIRIWGEGLRGHLRPHGVEVSVICPGFVVNDKTARNRYPRLFQMPAQEVAAIIKRGLARNCGRIAFPLPMYLVAWLAGALPPTLADAMFRRLSRKQ
jgi:short-subunit dehydrogenase